MAFARTGESAQPELDAADFLIAEQRQAGNETCPDLRPAFSCEVPRWDSRCTARARATDARSGGARLGAAEGQPHRPGELRAQPARHHADRAGALHPLECEPPDEESLRAGLDLERVRALSAACAAGLDADPRYFTTTVAMRDYEQVRLALGYAQINLLGISCGTRAAQVYYRQYPDRVRSMILDGVVPMRLALGAEHAPMLDRAVGEVPVLLLSGSRDPVTPPQFAAEVAEHFPRHANLVGRGLGHGAIVNPCMRRLAKEFLDSADPALLDTACVAAIGPAPLFTSLLGPGP